MKCTKEAGPTICLDFNSLQSKSCMLSTAETPDACWGKKSSGNALLEGENGFIKNDANTVHYPASNFSLFAIVGMKSPDTKVSQLQKQCVVI